MVALVTVQLKITSGNPGGNLVPRANTLFQTGLLVLALDCYAKINKKIDNNGCLIYC